MTLSEVEIPLLDGRTMRGVLARPDLAAPVAGVVLVHEIFGLDQAIREAAIRLADHGYAALAVDLFSHRGGRAVCLMRELGGMVSGRGSGSRTLVDLESGVDWLADQPAVDGARVGMVGFCWGGGVTLAFATEAGDLRAAAAFYGSNPRPLERVESIRCPVLAVYGSKDRFVTPGARPLADAMAARGKPFEWHVVEGVGHGFMRTTSRAYRADTGAEGWRLLLDFLDRQMLPGGDAARRTGAGQKEGRDPMPSQPT